MLKEFGWLLAFLPAVVIVTSVILNFTTIAALAQQGSLQQRDAIRNPRKTELRKAKKSVSTWSRLTYSVGVLNIGLTCYILGHSPASFWMWHAPKCVFLIGYRAVSFRLRKLHYYLFDFCYWVNLLSLVVIFVRPDSALLFRTLFIFSNGPLAWSVMAFNNSLLFHSIDHITSLFIHVSPMILSFGLRWNASNSFTVCDVQGEFPECPNTVRELLLPALTMYGIWMMLYYLWVFVLRGKVVQKRGYETLFIYLMTQPAVRAVLTVLGGKVVRAVSTIQRGGTSNDNKVDGEKTTDQPKINSLLEPVSTYQDFVNKAVYMLFHYTFGCVTMLLCVFLWNSYWAHFAFVVAILFSSAWNASLYYFQYIQFYQDAHL